MGDIDTNTIEGFWSLVKRGIGGVYHQVSQKYLQSYLDEYSFRYNRRDQGNLIFTSLLEKVSERAVLAYRSNILSNSARLMCCIFSFVSGSGSNRRGSFFTSVFTVLLLQVTADTSTDCRTDKSVFQICARGGEPIFSRILQEVASCR